MPVSVGLGLGVALLIEAGTSLRGFYRAAYFLPVTATLIAMAIVWEFMLHPSVGAVNMSLERVRPRRARLAAQSRLRRCTRWRHRHLAGVGFNMVLFLAGLKSMPRDLYEAAAVDGADGACGTLPSRDLADAGAGLVFVVVITGDPRRSRCSTRWRC